MILLTTAILCQVDHLVHGQRLLHRNIIGCLLVHLVLKHHHILLVQ